MYCVDKKKILNLILKFTPSKGSGITLTNNKIKDIIKAVKSLDNKRNFIEFNC